ncbi:MAG: hypothetical protein SGJ27_10630 [Candidatus Melainabacteria bacterium]|nr:hypothetical protein [Candidatus Melainabacteria bacterium]
MRTLVLSIILLLQIAPSVGAKDSLPIFLASDLRVLSADFGRFKVGSGPKDLKGKNISFQKTNKVSATGYSYGWRIRLDTPRKTVHVFEIWDDKNTQPQIGDPVEVVDGYIYHDWDVVTGTTRGKHTVEIFLEKQPVKKLVYFVN